MGDRKGDPHSQSLTHLPCGPGQSCVGVVCGAEEAQEQEVDGGQTGRARLLAAPPSCPGHSQGIVGPMLKSSVGWVRMVSSHSRTAPMLVGVGREDPDWSPHLLPLRAADTPVLA